MRSTLYYLMPINEFPDKLVKMTEEKTIVLWRNHDENKYDVFDTDKFMDKNRTPLQSISEDEYNRRYAEIFAQYIDEKSR